MRRILAQYRGTASDSKVVFHVVEATLSEKEYEQRRRATNRLSPNQAIHEKDADTLIEAGGRSSSLTTKSFQCEAYLS